MKNKIAVITGCSGGIGISLCSRFRAGGYTVFGIDVVKRKSMDIDEFFSVDLERLVTDERESHVFLNNFFAKVRRRPIHTLINNAAVQVTKGVKNLSIRDWTRTLNVNLVAPFFLIQNFAPYLRRSSGSIVNIGSIHSKLTKPQFVAYASSKAGLAGMTRALAVDLGSTCRINCIEPAAISTPMLMEGFKNDRRGFRQLKNYHPLKRIGTPADVANLAFFLASDDATFISGCTIGLDGGIGGRLHDPT